MSEDSYIIQSMYWYFSKANRGLHEILNMKIPVDGDNLRFYYGVYIESVLSALELMREKKYISFKEINDLLQPVEHEYFRELRNSIVHRGYDLSKEGITLNDKVYLRTPRDVENKKGEIVPSPNEELLIQFLIKIDNQIRNFIFSTTVTFFSNQVTEQDKNIAFNNLTNLILNHPHMSSDHKKLFSDNADSIKDALNTDESPQEKISNYESVIKFNGFFSN